MNQPKNIDQFLQGMNTIRKEYHKASNLLFNEIEGDIKDKSKFLRKQAQSIEDMVLMYNNLIIRINVLQNAIGTFGYEQKEGGDRIENQF